MEETRKIPVDEMLKLEKFPAMIITNPKQKKRGRKPKGPEIKKRTCAFSLSPETIVRLDNASRVSGQSKSDLVDKLLLHFFHFNP